MAGNEDNYKLSGKPKSGIFNRSITMHPTSTNSLKKPYLSPTLDRAGSMNKLYNPFETIVTAGNSIKGKVKKLCNFFESSKSPSPVTDELQSPKPKLAKSSSPDSRVSSILNSSSIQLPGTEDRIVVYLTSLRGIRRTFEDCYAVRMIFRGFRVYVDERDISMDSAYRKELQSVLGEKNVSLPQVFIRGNYVGGANVIKQLHEYGELAKILDGLPVRKPGYVCEGCGDVRFVPCSNCNGSRKVFDEEEDMPKRCLECNENGLIRCSNCCS
ncbi:hypothetical protein L1049_010851 [Liquidambar formosana]|uniref:Glutaredoxin domain-containing protein n=1 Tax=Liquidambar formosana TaxID=63359 RepID=A0AAP0RUG8_LIQFO